MTIRTVPSGAQTDAPVSSERASTGWRTSSSIAQLRIASSSDALADQTAMR